MQRTDKEKMMDVVNRFFNTRLLAVLALGFSSGLPLALTGTTLQAWYTSANVDLKTIGALSLIGLPYTLKFLWAPLMDYYGLSPLGKRKSWILLTQFLLFLSVLILSKMNPAAQAGGIGLMAFAIAFFSASQDISINAYTTNVLYPQERGLGAAYTTLAYRIAMLVSGGLALIFADYLGWEKTYEIMAVIMLFTMLPAYLAPDVVDAEMKAESLYAATKQALLEMFKRDKIILILLLIIFYKFGDALALSLISNFLLHGLGFSLTEVGVAYKMVSIVAMIIGGLAGGFFLMRWNIYYALLVFAIAQAVSNLMFAVLAFIGKHFLFMTLSVFIENFCSGLSTAALVAFIMSLCDSRYTATQFALLTAIAAVGRVFLGPIAALMVEHLGWMQFFIWSFLFCFPGIAMLVLLKDEVVCHVQTTD